ncbi:HesB/YadR/YfhF-family protein [Intrasporangium calvum]|uniref:HesB/YadR/YfhF-family protein n=1 Tax=Intrasporangium calvum (strain ATCC 23552 / DSM 43043 / JCM 3097 / NBRC 12989 / NCIMB 10167 / NRRL B-3866 / 7 KIP) TaxID=710696 RepID=E6S7A6_INTC7|nr:HesB/YadR/YfhF-family protein [Intrasporangium calvum]ADU49040.1 HesB/YadR/YfhF-family protein [Intrasporangium calvum DSM 43043]
MLTVTENAQSVVQGLTQGSPEESAGLRIAADDGQFAVTVVAAPQPDDVVVVAGNANVYVAGEVAPALEGQTLDAAETPDGVGFTLAQQA